MMLLKQQLSLPPEILRGLNLGAARLVELTVTSGFLWSSRNEMFRPNGQG